MFDFTGNQSTISVLLLDGFSTLSLGSILEPLHFFAERYPDIAPSVELVSAHGSEAVSNSGLRIECKLSLTTYSEGISKQRGKQVLMICGPTERAEIDAESLLPVLRWARLNRVAIFGVGSVCILMAHAGMFEDGKCAVHWRSLASFAEGNVDAEGANALFVKRNLIASCAGETAVLDLVVNLIAEISKEASVAIANHLLMSGPRFGSSSEYSQHRLSQANLTFGLYPSSFVKLQRTDIRCSVTEVPAGLSLGICICSKNVILNCLPVLRLPRSGRFRQ